LGINPSPLNSAFASSNETSGGGRITSEPRGDLQAPACPSSHELQQPVEALAKSGLVC
jgi:hypothetical protein